MFGFFKRRPTPTLPPVNPGQGPDVRVSYPASADQASETYDLVELTAEVLTALGHDVDRHEAALEDRASGLVLEPRYVTLLPHPDGRFQTVTTIQVTHPTLIPAGLFEYQHSFGEDPREAFRLGFEQWANLDLVTLLAALDEKPEGCTTLVLEIPGDSGKPPRVRRAVLGPVAHFLADPEARQRQEAAAASEEHPFCPCCLLTNSLLAFQALLDRDETFGLRLFASRDERARPDADCRVNGGDFEPGARALRKYAGSWPPNGYEFRKQYVVLHSLDRAPEIT